MSSIRRRSSRRRAARRTSVLGAALILVAGLLPLLASSAQAADPCGPDGNPVACENQKVGSPAGDWQVNGSTYGDIVGFGTKASVLPGEALPFKIKTPSANWSIEIYRLGFYGGTGGRLVTTVMPSVTLPQTQPACATQASTGLYDCGTWAVSATWDVPADAVTGFYVANFNRLDGTPGINQFPFVVRDDASTSDLVVQTSDQTWQAYNKYGGNSLYVPGTVGSSNGRGYKVSYNRPYLNANKDNFMNAEYPLVRWLERNGYDVSYISSLDTIQNPALLLNHQTFISSGHDEYWSGEQRASVEAARAAGVNLAFFAGNEMYWKTRFEPSIDGTSTANRTLVSYKETEHSAAATKIDPSASWTGTWRDPRLSPPSDGGRPENAVTGTLYQTNGYRFDAMKVPSDFAKLRFWKNTAVANLTAGQSATLPQGTLGYEWDGDPDNGFRPAGAIQLSRTTVNITEGSLLLDYGYSYGNGSATHNLVLYRDPTSGALVFGSGTVQWSWGLDTVHLNPQGGSSPPEDPRIQQATVNLLADMEAQPVTLQAGLVAAAMSTDTTGPSVSIGAPAQGATLQAGTATTISGTAADAGGGVPASVEVSVDGGLNWKRATPAANGNWATWSYPWTPAAAGSVQIRVRASDDSANLGATQTRGVTVQGQAAPPPVVTSANPASGATGVATNTQVVATFDRAVTPASLTFTLTGPSGAVAGAQNLSANGLTATFTPGAALVANTSYTASVRATGTDGVQMPAAASWSFITASAGGGGGGGGTGLTIFGTATPATVDSQDSGAVELGVRFKSSANATVTGVRFYKATANTGTHTGSLWSTSGTRLATGTFTGETATGWQTLTFATPVAIAANTTYIASYFAPVGRYSSDRNYFTSSGASNPPLSAPQSVTGAGNGVYKDGGGFPTDTWQNSNYYVDVIATTEGAPTEIPPSVVATSPASGATGVSPTSPVTATFDRAVNPTTLTFTLSGPSAAVAGTPSLSADGLTATFTPSAPLAASTSYTASVRATATDGVQMPGPAVWSFTTAAAGGGGGGGGGTGTTIFGTATPSTVDSQDGGAVELGVRFSSSVEGMVTGVRFYKATANTGTHTGSLWNLSGTRLATGTFTGESGSGWQTLTFASPVPIAANTTYIASYFAPVGRYSADRNYFTSQSATNAPLTAPQSATGAGNGVYKNGGGFPTETWLASNYYVDVFVTAGGGTPIPPSVTSTTPASGSTGVATSTTATAVFSEAITPGSLAFTLSGPSGAVGGSATVSADGRTATFTPAAALTAGASYTASVRASDVDGNQMPAAVTWSFTTQASGGGGGGTATTLFGTTVPGTIDSKDNSATELGMRFTTSVNGSITGVKFYKAAANTGTHTGSLWTATGTLLATGTFSGETASGWQTLTFASPVPVTAGTQYIASYFAPVGRYAATRNYFASSGKSTPPLTAPQSVTGAGNGVYRGGTGYPTQTFQASNYWVDVLFVPAS